MYTLKFTNQFKKDYRLMIRQGKDISLLDNVIEKIHTHTKTCSTSPSA